MHFSFKAGYCLFSGRVMDLLHCCFHGKQCISSEEGKHVDLRLKHSSMISMWVVLTLNKDNCHFQATLTILFEKCMVDLKQS